MESKQPRKKSYTIRFKRSVIMYAQATGSNRKTSMHFNVPRTNIIEWVQQSGKYFKRYQYYNQNSGRISHTDDNSRVRSCQNPNVEKIVFDWFLEQRSLRICVGVFSLKIKMNEVIKTLNEQKKFNINFIHILTNN